MPSSTGLDPAPRRAVCPACARPASACICRWVVPVPHRVELLILQHPLEVANAKNSARLLHLCLPQSRILTGEAFTDAACLTAAWNAGDAPRHVVLLYPETAFNPLDPLDRTEDLAPSPAPDTALLADPSRLRLVLLDGTWRKSRKMLYASPALRQLPRLALRDMPASRYLIRKAHRPDQLSTLEAACAALSQTEGDAVDVRPLLAAFDGFVAQQAAFRSLKG